MTVPSLELLARRLVCCLCIAVFCDTARADEDPAPALLEGVSEIAAPGIPGPLVVFGEHAFVVAVGKSGDSLEPVVAAAQIGTGSRPGRVVAFGHNGYLGADNLKPADTERLMLNAIRWAGHGPNPGRVMVFRQDALVAWLRARRVDAVAGDPNTIASSRVFIADAGDLTKLHLPRVAGFVNAGGGLITATCGWGWEQVTKHSVPAEFPANEMLAPWGLIFTNGMVGHTTTDGYAARTPPPPLTHAAFALAAVKAQMTGGPALSSADAAQVSTTLGHAATALPPGEKSFLPLLHQLLSQHPAAVVPTHEHPILKADTAARLLLSLQINDSKNLPASEVKAHPASLVFPGAVPDDARPVTRPVNIDTRVPGWHSLGLYAAPGALITVEIPFSAAHKGLSVRIGAHTDTLWDLDRWERAPEITRVFPLNDASTPAANAFGGLVYLVVPDDAKLGVVAAKISGAVEAPLYVRGQTNFIQWRTSIRNAPGPWAELATDKLVLTVPSSVVRTLEDPEPLLQYWDDGMDAEADLATIPRARKRPERIVADAQISLGYMHSGYPIMTCLDVAPMVVNLPRLRHGTWGHWHELGHNHQQGDWTFDGTGEVTVNLFTLYAHEKLGINLNDKLHPNVQEPWQQEVLKKYLAGGAKFEDWKKDPFLALYMYIQLQRAFGWDTYKKIFAQYRALPANERPKNDDEKRDQWMVRFSRLTGNNLGPFFLAWGVPTSEKARASIAGLPVWMPPDWPR